MNGIKLKISKPKDKLPAGSSKLFGNPDVWDGFEWPHIEENGEKYDLTFMCQIDCAKAEGFDESGLLPKTGILYFFYDLDTMPEAPDEKSSRVLWYNGELSALHEMILTDYNGVVRLVYGMIIGIVVYRTVSIIAVFIINSLYRKRNAKKAAALRAGNFIP